MEKNYWVMRMGKGAQYVDVANKGGFVAVGWTELGVNFTEYKGLDKNDFSSRLEPFVNAAYGDKSKNSKASVFGQLFRFINLMHVGDVVLLPKTADGVVYAGVIDSEYYFDTAKDGCEFPHRRKVRWTKTFDLAACSTPLRNAMGSILTVFGVSGYAEEIEQLISGAAPAASAATDSAQEFAIEKHLEDFLVENWKNTELGKDYDILTEDGAIIGQQYVTEVGRIDILARSKDGKRWLIVELKKGRSNDEVVGQILRYFGWISKNEAGPGETVRGIIITREEDEKLRYALAPLTHLDISHMTYRVNFQLQKANNYL